MKSLPKGTVSAFELDQSDPKNIDDFLKQLPGKVDILINNGALGTKTVKKIAHTFESQDETFFKVNTLGPLWLTTKILPMMKESGFGKIVFISSVDGGITYFPGARHADGMSKAAITHFAKHLAAELTDSPIDVYAVCPGATDTPMFTASTLANLSAKQREAFCKSLPGGRLISPKEIAALTLFLCSSNGSLLRGAVLDSSMGLGNNPFSIHMKRKKK